MPSTSNAGTEASHAMLRRKLAYTHRRVEQRSIAEAAARTAFLAPFIIAIVLVPFSLVLIVFGPVFTWWSIVVQAITGGLTIYGLIRALEYAYTRSRWAFVPNEGSVRACCGYNLKGNVSGRCPECGETSGRLKER